MYYPFNIFIYRHSKYTPNFFIWSQLLNVIRKEFGKLAGMIPLVWASKVLAEAADDEGDADGDAVVQAGRWFNLSGCRRF